MAACSFCEPQFRGMWRDAAWHRERIRVIKSVAVDPALLDTVLVKRIRKLTA